MPKKAGILPQVSTAWTGIPEKGRYSPSGVHGLDRDSRKRGFFCKTCPKERLLRSVGVPGTCLPFAEAFSNLRRGAPFLNLQLSKDGSDCVVHSEGRIRFT
jgi:hypothetical protein